MPALENAVQTVQEAVSALIERLRLPPLAPDERRRQARAAYAERIEVRCETLMPVFGFARNLSKGGMAFLATGALPLEDCIIRLPQPTGPPLGLRARILRCDRIKDGLYDVGASFLALVGATGAERKTP